MKRSLLILLALAAAAGCEPGREGADIPAPAGASREARDAEWFVDRTEEVGLDFKHVNGMVGGFHYLEIMAPGVGMFDYDGDGDLDIYVVQGKMLGPAPPGGANGPPLNDRLYRNDLEVHQDGTRSLLFTDVTAKSGIVARGYGMGVAAGDINNDGWVDLYLTRFGANQMFRNKGDGTFSEISKQSGTDDASWSVSASFLDFDRDGWLDLYVGNYLNYSVKDDIHCFSLSGKPDYCAPSVYRPQPDRLYRNRGDGTFADVTSASGIADAFGPALGVSTADFNGDGWIDIYVANDGQENQLWMNQRDGSFKNAALLSGAALNAAGKAEASMGVDAGDFDNDGDEDLFIANLTGEGATLYVNNGVGAFDDHGALSGLRPQSLAYTGFGAAWLDLDNDGWLDVSTMNGGVRMIEALGQADALFPLNQPNQLFRNLGNGRFEGVTARAGAAFRSAEVSRGAAFGDIDNDGDTDVLVGNNNGKLRLLINAAPPRAHWLGLKLVKNRTPRDMVGARVRVDRTGRPPLWRRARADGSYASANDPRVLVGLGDSIEVPRVQVTWPSGRVEEWTKVPLDRYTTLTEGGGK